MEQIKQKQKWWKLAFIVSIVAFVIMNMFDGASAWFCMLSNIAIVKNIVRDLSFENVSLPLGFLFSSPGIVFALFPLMAIIYFKNEKTSLAFSIINVLLALLFTILMFLFWWPLGTVWSMYFIASIVLLKYSLGTLKKRKNLVIYFFILGIVSVILHFILYYLCCLPGFFNLGSVSHSLTFYIASLFAWDSHYFLMISPPGVFYPLSRALLYFALGAGLMCTSSEREINKSTAQKATSVQTKQGGNHTMVHKNKLTAILLSIFVGTLGIDRFYLGYTGLGLVKLLTIGGFGVWTLIDLIMICTGSLRPADGSPWEEEVQRAQTSAIAQSAVSQQNQDSSVNSVDAIEKLAKLHEQGILTDEEFQQKKADLLAKL